MSMMRFIILLLFTAGLLSQATHAQRMVFDESDFQSKWVTGGGFGLSFSTFGSSIQLSPLLGYRISPRWETGIRLNYHYYSYRDDAFRFDSHNYGGGPYTNYVVYRGIFAHAEYEALSYERLFLSGERDRDWVHSIFIGGGLRQYFSPRSFASFLILYNLNETFDSPYANPTFRVGFGFGL